MVLRVVALVDPAEPQALRTSAAAHMTPARAGHARSFKPMERESIRPVASLGPVTDDPGLVIFDCDGVLVDSERLTVEIERQILSEFGLEFTTAEVVARFMGRSEGIVEATIEQSIGRVLTPDEREQMAERFAASYERHLVPIAGIAEALNAIRSPICVASSSKPEGLRWKLELCGLLERFDGAIFSAVQVAHGKPAPDLFLLAAATMGFEPSRCVVVEDSPYGLQAARAAGMCAFAHVTGMIPEEVLAGPGTVLFSDMRELPGLIGAAAVD